MKKEKCSSRFRPNAHIWSHANTFEKSALLCQQKDLIQPMAVNAALAIELYLKSFLAIDFVRDEGGGKYSIEGFGSKRGHTFQGLIDEMDQFDRESLFKELENINPNRNWISSFEKYEGMFVKVRYWYETESKTIIDHEIVGFAEELGRAVKKVGELKGKSGSLNNLWLAYFLQQGK